MQEMCGTRLISESEQERTQKPFVSNKIIASLKN